MTVYYIPDTPRDVTLCEICGRKLRGDSLPTVHKGCKRRLRLIVTKVLGKEAAADVNVTGRRNLYLVKRPPSRNVA